VYSRSTFLDRRQLATTQNAAVNEMVKLGVFHRQRATEYRLPVETKFGVMADIQSATAEIRRGKKKKEERKKEETTGQKYNGLPYSIGRP